MSVRSITADTDPYSSARRRDKGQLNDDELLKDFLLEAFPNPERKGCPDVQTIKALAEDRLPPGHPARLHIGSCSECYGEYRNYRLDWKESSKGVNTAEAGPQSSIAVPHVSGPSLVPSSDAPVPHADVSASFPPQTARRNRGLAIAAMLLLVAGGSFYGTRIFTRHAQTTAGALEADSKPVDVRVDLSNAVTARGVDDALTPVQEVTLPASVVRLSVSLPHFSQSGRYALLVSTDREGKNVVAEGLGNAVQSGDDVNLQSTLDLRKAKPGAYFLATVRGSDNGTYYYPLRVR